MNEMNRRYIEFETLLFDLFEHLQFKAQHTLLDTFDLKISRDDQKYIIEIKLYRTQRALMPLVMESAIRLVEVSKSHPEYKPILITSCSLTFEQRQTLTASKEIDVIDREDLIALTSQFPHLQEHLYSLLEISPDCIPEQPAPHIQDLLPLKEISRRLPRRTRQSKAVKLKEKINSLPTGKNAWRDYEKLCIEIIKYLFEKSLDGWHEQLTTEDDLNRYDYVCRVKPSTGFWEFILESLNSRYVIFEFKNHENPIKQGQILTTEKYLSERALRKVAIVISRSPPSESAKRMAQGAMRESGKLIIMLSDEDIINMLELREIGSDASDYLFSIVDDFLLKLPR